ncbi:MAG: fimbrial biogenesis chaperone [Paracoccaceae bacterium]
MIWSASALGSYADSVSVSPTRLSVPSPNQATTMTVKAGGNEASILQVRVMRWNERDDPSKMKPTRDVVVSPPAAKLKANQELTVRIIRTKSRAVRGRECYRVLVDRLPGREQDGQAVKLRVRHSVPLCFTS